LPAPSALAEHWRLDPGVVFLNHGSYGACPVKVLECQDEIRTMMEREAVRFFMIELERLLDETREAVGRLVNCRPRDLVMATNATIALACVLNSIDFQPGDEILANDHEYMSCLNELDRLARRRGVRPVKATVPFPIDSDDQVVEAIMDKVTPRTRLVLVSHITSPSALILPVARIVAECRARGIQTLVDGAHAPGQIPIDITALGPTYYVADFHKWISAPKGAGMLYVDADQQDVIEPLALSSRAHFDRPDRDRFRCLFDYVGTDDYSSILAVPAAIEHLGSLLPGGWDQIMRENRAMVLRARDLLCRALGAEPPAPDSMIASMTTILLPPLPDALVGRPCTFDDPLQDRLVERHRVQVPIWQLPDSGQRFIRLSAQLYNSIEQYEYLARALKEELAGERQTGAPGPAPAAGTASMEK